MSPRPGVRSAGAAAPWPGGRARPGRSALRPSAASRTTANHRISPRVAMWCRPSRQLMCTLPPPRARRGGGTGPGPRWRVAAGGGWEREATGKAMAIGERSGRARPSARPEAGAALPGRVDWAYSRVRRGGPSLRLGGELPRPGGRGAGSCCRAVVGLELRQRVGIAQPGRTRLRVLRRENCAAARGRDARSVGRADRMACGELLRRWGWVWRCACRPIAAAVNLRRVAARLPGV